MPENTVYNDDDLQIVRTMALAPREADDDILRITRAHDLSKMLSQDA